MQTVNLIIGSVIQIILFSLIPFIWWFTKNRKEVSFFQWIGMKKPVILDKKKYSLSFFIALILFFSLSFIIPLFIKGTDTATSQFSGQGIYALIPALIYSFLQTGLSEEIFFRGFLTKRLVNAFGFARGNLIQGLLFGLMHGVLFFSVIGMGKALIIVLITGIIGFLMGWINEKQSGGSIISSWLLHGFANIFASIVTMFSLI